MAISMRSVSSSKVAVSRRVQRTTAVRPVAAMNMQKAAASLAVVGSLAAIIAAPAEASNLVSTLASATEGYPFIPPSWAPSVLVPFTGLVIPGIVMASLFVYIEKDA